MLSSAVRKRKPALPQGTPAEQPDPSTTSRSAITVDVNNDNLLLPLHKRSDNYSIPQGAAISTIARSRKRTKGRICDIFSKICHDDMRKKIHKHDDGIKLRRTSSFLLFLLLLLLFFVFFMEKVWVSHSLSSYPNYNRLSSAQPPTPIRQATIALVSLHEQDGWIHHKSLGRFLRNNKQSYANLHGYSFIDSIQQGGHEKMAMAPLQPWQKDGDNDYKKLQLIQHVMDTYQNLEWILWMDGNAIITQPYISIEERIKEFRNLRSQTMKEDLGDRENLSPDLCLVSATNHDSSPDAGVMLIRNSSVLRDLLKMILTGSEGNSVSSHATKEAPLATAIRQLQTHHECSLLLQGDSAARLQIRVKPGQQQLQWKPGDWILYHPNHSYLQFLSSLRKVGGLWRESPPPIFPPLSRPSVKTLSQTRKKRFKAVQQAILHAWRGYADVCLNHPMSSSSYFKYKYLGSHIPCDDLSPLSQSGHDWLYHAATLHDSLDTLVLAFGAESLEYREALDVILRQDLQATALRPTKTFEYSLRIVGGLLGAFSVTGDLRLLARAKEGADAMLYSAFESSPTVLPRIYDVLFPPRGGSMGVFYKIYSRVYQWGRDKFTNEHHYNSLAGVGSFSLEFYFLFQMLGMDKYREAADRIFQHVASHQGKDGTVPNVWNVMTGAPTTKRGGIGSGSDSFVEYLIKVPLLSCNKDDGQLKCGRDDLVPQDMLALYEKIVNGPLSSNYLIQKIVNPAIAYPVEDSTYDQLLCFVPGMVALGSSANEQDDGNDGEIALAEALIQGCHEMYTQMKTGLGPERIKVTQDGPQDFVKRSYFLRPEYVESLFILYKLTGKEQYQEMGYEVFQSLEKYCKTEFGGYVGVKDVDDPSKGNVDDMPSYFIAETLKYLLLLFGPDDLLSLKDYVLTTEAHPMMRQTRFGKEKILPHTYIQAELSDGAYVVPAPFPWFIFCCVLLVFIILVIFIVAVKKMMAGFIKLLQKLKVSRYSSS